MLKLLSSLLSFALLVAVCALGLLLLANQSRPLVAVGPQPSAAEARWLRTLVNGDGSLRPGSERPRRLELSPRQLDLLVDMAAQRIGGGHARVALHQGAAELLASFPTPWERGGFANLRIQLSQTEGVPKVTAGQVGGVAVPAALAQHLAQRGIDSLAFADLLGRVRLSPDGAELVYRRPSDALNAMAGGLFDDVDQHRLLERQAWLAEIVDAQPRAGRVDLALLLSPLLARGADASAPGTDAAADNRAALAVLAAYVNGRRLRLPRQADSPAPGPLPNPRPLSVQLRGRKDLAQHFMVSAAMAAEGGAALSHLIGLTKELNDAEGGSGFSFADLTANRAGIRFAELATGSVAGARYAQLMARAGLDQEAIMPSIDGLPEGMQRDVLKREVGIVDSPDYQRLLAYIDRRIDQTPLHRGAPIR